jgi:hypothetical protein
VALNPQPLPPKEGPLRAALVARTMIAGAIDITEAAEAITGSSDAAAQAVRAKVAAFVDDWCGTPPRPRPFPRPWGPLMHGDEGLRPIDLVAAGVQFQKAAEVLADGPLGATFQGAADALVDTGLSRLEEA